MAYTTHIDQDVVVFFPIVNSSGIIQPGLNPADFTVTVMAPTGVALDVLGLVESVHAGVYTFTVPSTFFIAQGVGNYVWFVQKTGPGVDATVTDTIYVLDTALDALGVLDVRVSVTFDASANTLRVNTWLQQEDGQSTLALTNATLRLFDRTGAPLTALQTAPTPDAQSVFAFNFAAPAFVVGETETYFVATIDVPGPPVHTIRGVVGTTFSRTS